MISARKAKLSKLEAERQKLKVKVENQKFKIDKLQQFLEEANERREADARKNMETYGRNLHLKSSLATAQRGEAIGEYTPFDKGRAEAPGVAEKSPLTAIKGPWSNEQRLEQQSVTTNPSHDATYEGLVATLERIKAAVAEESHEDLLATLETVKQATAGETTESSNDTLSRNIVAMVHKILDGRERLAHKEEVLESVISPQRTVPVRSISRLPPATISTSRRSSRIPITADLAR